MLNIKVPERKKHMSLSFAARVVYNSKKFTQPLVMGYSANGVSGVREKKCSWKSNLHMQHLIFIPVVWSMVSKKFNRRTEREWIIKTRKWDDKLERKGKIVPSS